MKTKKDNWNHLLNFRPHISKVEIMVVTHKTIKLPEDTIRGISDENAGQLEL